ncbi:hypothetical protein [Roseisalinus antarcticus]|uniref:O-Antigen ligase n=1 Tax=Roseisalinus antarcticus TaxID=254357 RepID=A0A1Y5TTD7_9RHOB|nr:hypothetical protein [Roseisalinus antarcticus]SLN69242.1 hypothetical protein ROA7023_03370 [Roseisalinus antarcticus]
MTHTMTAAHPRARTARDVLKVFASVLAFLLWVPAIGLPAGPIWLQPVDILVILAYPLIVTFLPQMPVRTGLMILFSMGASMISLLVGGEVMILIYYLGFVMPFMAVIGVIARAEDTRRAFIRGFVLGGACSALFFLLQFAVGAETLDFRTNRTFGLVPQYGRGFALFPEVSTFTTHTIYLLAVLIVLWRGGRAYARVFSFGRVVPLILIALACLILSRSSSVVLIAPIMVIVAYFKGRRLGRNGLIGAALLVILGSAVLNVFVTEFYAERFGEGGLRSMYLRGISIVSGLSVLTSGETLGVGVGNNHMITERAWDVARQIGFVLILVPEGINSFVVSRIFEEGWPAALMFLLGAVFVVRAIGQTQPTPYARAFAVLAVGSMLVSLMVTGYRGIYMNWFWLAAAPALIQGGGRRDQAPRSG